MLLGSRCVGLGIALLFSRRCTEIGMLFGVGVGLFVGVRVLEFAVTM